MKITTILLLLAFHLNAQELIPYLSGGKYGYADIEGNIILKPAYDEVTFFEKNGFAHVRRGKFWTLINKEGKLLLPFVSKSKPVFNLVFNTPYEKSDYRDIDTLKALRQFVWTDKHPQVNNNGKSETYKRPDTYVYIINMEVPDTTSVYLIENREMQSKICLSNYPNFKYGYFIGKTKYGDYRIINTNGETVISCKNKPTLWNDNFLSYPTEGNTILIDLVNEEKHNIPYQTIHGNINNTYLIISDEEINNTDIISFNPKKPPPKKGIVDFDSNVILDTIYKRLYWDGQNLIARNENASIIDFKGNKISTGEYSFIFSLSPQYYKAKQNNDKLVILTKDGQKANEQEFDKIHYYDSGKYYSWENEDMAGILDSNLSKVISYPSESIHYFYSADNFYFKKNQKVGILHKDKSEVLPPIYDEFRITADSFIVVFKDGEKGLANLKGQILFEPIYEDFAIVEDNDQIYFRPKKDGFYACFNQNLEKIEDFNSKNSRISSRIIDWYWDNEKDIRVFTNKYGAPLGISTKNFKTGYIKSDSTYVVIIYDYKKKEGCALFSEANYIPSDLSDTTSTLIHYNINSGLFGIKKDSLEGVVNHKKEIILPLSNRKIFEISDHIIITVENNKHYIYDHSGKLIHQNGFDYVDDFPYKLRQVGNKVEGKTYKFTRYFLDKSTDTLELECRKIGYIDEKGKLIVPLEYNETFRYFDQYAFLSIGFKDGEKKSYLVDTLGNIVLETTYDKLYPLGHTDSYKQYKATINGKEGLIDINGKILMPFEYNAITAFCGTDLYFVRDTNMVWHLINSSSKTIYSDVNLSRKTPERCHILPNNKVLLFPNGNSEIIDLDGNKYAKIKGQDVKIVETNGIKLIEVSNANNKYFINAESLVEYKDASD